MANANTFDALLAFAHRLADLSGAAILPHFRDAHGRVDNKSQQGPYDPVTAADRAAEEVIRAAVAEAYPVHGLLGEEFGALRPEAELQWVIDPIDGTRAFIMGLPLWGTLIGLTQRGKPLLGLMQQPFTGERYWSTAEGAHYRGPEGERDLRTRPCPSLSEAVLSTTTPDMFAAGDETERFERLSRAARMRRYGGDCYSYCQLAAGHVDVIIEAGLKPYDIVALIPIVEKAGGCVTTWEGGDAAGGGRIVATGDPRLHEQMVKALSV